MLRTRVITAVLLFALFFGALFHLPPLGWLIFVSAVAAIAAWEWGGLIGLGQAGRLALGASFACTCAAVAAFDPPAVGLAPGFAEAGWRLGRWFYLPAAAFWLLVVPFWLRWRWPLVNLPLALMTGFLLILPAWLALLQLRQGGPVFLLGVMAVVWVADIGAYFAGRRFGRHKLAPAISPGKTWEGAIGGALGVAICGLLASSRLPVALADNVVLLVSVLIALTAISIVGDLFESLVKREAGLKDSSQILPGHGGVLDRIDSLTSTLPLVALLWLLAGPR
ncbi:MAG TPA: phosphatidate cytidylyltransferase [Accumulibacter sp.]|uniref:phosphatidate cytidylyltransferase n=1 Tax=Accumulibacter sp. TaxID=2053492 RepID=UPI00287AF891|nr:phosphatidate cytidylyltransferase [Accumulibacter sp.]MDS4053438.1 phosphatidate cytidylyltransferase [Accumulibacter sp.]HMW62690.1 phosphatidate cytidylyltransferase [Accumulibacter sp.]HMW79471.1 phosphatidate cytidylyltransferase [Accumulibacter sp.]HMX68316.1 phosphatidate cytidylyltransferase [Accumulibacter sp.]HNB67347.1 phosphatidate cytidylyltransferase [Accumulibacter sp.]